MIEDKLFSDKELDKIRWQFALLLGPYCGAYKTDGTGICRHKAGYGTKTPGHGRCRKHGGSSTGPMDKRMITMNKLTKLDKRSKLSTDIFNEKEMKLYEDLQEMIRSEYEITDPIAISQVARLLIYQNFLLDKMNQGFNINIEGSSKEIRAWLESYGLTPKSRNTFNLDGADPGLLARVIIDVHDKMEAKRLQEEEENKG